MCPARSQGERVCRDAGTRAPADGRAEERYAVEGTASAEAGGFPGAARKRKEAGAGEVAVAVFPDGDGCGGDLAKTVIRLQRVERGEAEREAAIHARESRETKTGAASERLGVEQLVALLERGGRPDPD